jgi:hypothetical protein
VGDTTIHIDKPTGTHLVGFYFFKKPGILFRFRPAQDAKSGICTLDYFNTLTQCFIAVMNRWLMSVLIKT